jgi:hypothetical protein
MKKWWYKHIGISREMGKNYGENYIFWRYIIVMIIITMGYIINGDIISLEWGL